jgi:hypothetical protein
VKEVVLRCKSFWKNNEFQDSVSKGVLEGLSNLWIRSLLQLIHSQFPHHWLLTCLKNWKLGEEINLVNVYMSILYTEKRGMLGFSNILERDESME